MLQKCPYYFTKVLPNKDRTCPACLKNIDEIVSKNKYLDTIWINDFQELPNICINCKRSSKSKIEHVDFEKGQ